MPCCAARLGGLSKPITSIEHHASPHVSAHDRCSPRRRRLSARHPQGPGHSRSLPAPLDHGRRARGHPDAGEPRLRPLLRDAAGRARLRRPRHASRCPAAGRSGSSSSSTARTVLPYRPRQHDRQCAAGIRHPALLARRAGRLEQGRDRPVAGLQAAVVDGLLRRAGAARSSSRSPARSRSATRTSARSTRAPIRTACSCSPARTIRRDGWRTGHHQRERLARPARRRLSPGRPTPSVWKLRASAGRSTRTSRTTSATTRWPASGSTASRSTAAPRRRWWSADSRRRSPAIRSTGCATTCSPARCLRCRGSSPPRRTPSIRGRRAPSRAPGTRSRCWRP